MPNLKIFHPGVPESSREWNRWKTTGLYSTFGVDVDIREQTKSNIELELNYFALRKCISTFRYTIKCED